MTSAIRRCILLFAALGLAAGVGAGFYAMLQGLRTGNYDPRGVPSVLIGRPVPEFAPLPPLEGADVPPFSSADLRVRQITKLGFACTITSQPELVSA